MTLTRRHVLCGGAALLGAATLPRFAVAELRLAEGATLTTLSDGHLTLPADFIVGDLPMDQVAPVLEAYGQTLAGFTPPCNVTLYRDGTNTVLFDVGAGPDFQPTAGQIDAALDAVGVAPEDVTHVVMTHGHPDHIWGLLDDFDDAKFYNARHLIGRAERDFWTDPATVNSIGEARTTFAVGAERRLAGLADFIEVFEDGDEVLPGVTAIGTYGHTPGHMSFAVAAGDRAAMVLGDAIANHHLSFARPGWEIGSDQDAATAAATRLALFDRLRADGMAIVGFHLPEGGIGRIDTQGEGFRFVADV